MVLDFIWIAFGLGLLVLGADGLVRGAASIAAKLRVSPLVIGLTVVAFGTSAPELTVSLTAAINGSTDIAVGNVVGSGIANILLILGICALIAPLKVKSSTVWKEIPLALMGALLLFIFGNDVLLDGVSANVLSRTDGLALLALFIIFMYYIFGMAKHDRAEMAKAGEKEEKITQYSWLLSTAFVIGGLGILVVGGRLLVSGAVGLAEAAGLSEALIGLTIVAVGTSMPELATSLVATRKGHTDIAIGNIVGSNIFNVFWILGASSIIHALPISDGMLIDILVAVGATLLLFAVMFLGKRHRLERWEGIVFLLLYVAYTAYLINRG